MPPHQVLCTRPMAAALCRCVHSLRPAAPGLTVPSVLLGRSIGSPSAPLTYRAPPGPRSALQPRSSAPPLPSSVLRQRRLLRQGRQLARAAGSNGSEPGSWEDWEDEGELAAASSPAAAAWASWYSLPQGQQSQGGAAAETGGGGSSSSRSSFVGRQGETQQLQASTSGRDHASEQQQGRQQAASQVGSFTPASAPHHRWQRVHSSNSDPGSGGGGQIAQVAAVSRAIPPPSPRPSGVEARYFTLGAIAAVTLHYLINFTGTLPVVRSLVQRFVWWSEPKGPALPPTPPGAGAHGGADGLAGGAGNGTTALAVQYSEDAETVEWVNMCWRKVGRGRRGRARTGPKVAF